MGTSALNHTAPPAIKATQQQQVMATRTDVATTTRAFQDLSAQVQANQRALVNKMSEAGHLDQEDFQAMWDARNRLNAVSGQLDSVKTELMATMPAPTDFQARLSDAERQAIRGFYATGLYTQQALAEQYGVSQPTIARILEGA